MPIDTSQQQKSSDDQSSPPLKPPADQPIHIIKSETPPNPFTDTTQNTKSADIKTDTKSKQTWPKSVSQNKTDLILVEKKENPFETTLPMETTDIQKQKELIVSQEKTVMITPMTYISSPISLLYEDLQNTAQKNPISLYSIIKKPSSYINTIELSNELTTIANNNQTVLYLPYTSIKNIMEKLGFTQKININNRWTITTPTAKVHLEFIDNMVGRLTVDTDILTENSTPDKMKELTSTSSNALTLQQPPIVVFSLPIPNTKTLTIEKNTILAVKPNLIEPLLVDFFFKLLKKGQKIESETINFAKKIPTDREPQQKISPTMRKILNLPNNNVWDSTKYYTIPKSKKPSSLLPEWIQINPKRKNKSRPPTISQPKVNPIPFKTPIPKPTQSFSNFLPKKLR